MASTRHTACLFENGIPPFQPHADLHPQHPKPYPLSYVAVHLLLYEQFSIIVFSINIARQFHRSTHGSPRTFYEFSIGSTEKVCSIGVVKQSLM